MVMVTGPRLDPGVLPDVEGMEKRGYVDSLFEHLACADVAVVQGGLSTTMELTAARRPFVYFPSPTTGSSSTSSPTGSTTTVPASGWTTATTPPDLATAMMTARTASPRTGRSAEAEPTRLRSCWRAC